MSALIYPWSVQVNELVIWICERVSLGRHRTFHKIFITNLDPSSGEQMNKWLIQWRVMCIYIKVRRTNEKEIYGRLAFLLEVRGLGEGESQKIYYNHFRMWQINSNLIMLKEDLLIFIYRTSRIWGFYLFFFLGEIMKSFSEGFLYSVVGVWMCF